MAAPVSDQTIYDISHVIQLSVAPVFLLTAIGTILGVLSNRLARIVDRARALNERLEDSPGNRLPAIRAEMGTLAQRRRMVNLAITFGTTAALLVCVSIATVFLGAVMRARSWARDGVSAPMARCLPSPVSACGGWSMSPASPPTRARA